MQNKIIERVWHNGDNFNEIVIHKGYPILRVDTRFIYLIYGYHRTKNFPINFFRYGCWNGGHFTSSKAPFKYGSYDPCTTVNIPDFMDLVLNVEILWISQNYA